MTCLEELCKSITHQLQLFDQRHAKLRRELQAENSALRAQLKNFVQADTPRSRDLAYETPIPPCSASLSHFNLAARGDAIICTPKLKSSETEASNGSMYRFACGAEGSPTCLPSVVRNLPTTPHDEESVHKVYESSSYAMDAKNSIFSFTDSLSLDGVWAKWHKIICTMMNMSLLGVERSKLESALLLRAPWETTNLERPIIGKRSSVATWLTNSTPMRLGGGSVSSCERDGIGPLSMRVSKYSRWILHPDSRFVTTWSLLGALMILYDVLTFPLAGFDLEESDLQVALMLITTIFWTSDIILTFLRGVHIRGVIEMRPSRICWLYAKSWLFIDLLMVTIDWFVLYMTAGGDTSIAGASKVLRSGKALRAARVVRAIRLIRTIKVLVYLREVFENIKSEYYQLLIKLWASIVAILVLSHYVTCSWFAQAHFSSNPTTWITVFLGNDPRPRFVVEYVTSMHFALTQLAGSQNIVPQNGMERFIASVIIVFDIVIFSTLVGIITDIMAQFRSLTFERSTEVNLIRKFFARSALPPLLESRIWHFFRHHYRSRRRFVNECEIEFFKYLPSSLKMDLHHQLYIPVLNTHPLYNAVLKYDRYSILAVCVTALTTTTIVPEVEVFAEGDIAKFMFFITGGTMNYKARQFGIQTKAEAGVWIAEATIWTKWMHCGRLTAESNCEMLKVDADGFEKTIYERAETADWLRGLRKYAALFAQRVSDSFDTSRPITDVDRDLLQLESIVEKSFFYMAALISYDNFGTSSANLKDKDATKEDGQHLALLTPLFKIKRTLSKLSSRASVTEVQNKSLVSGDHIGTPALQLKNTMSTSSVK